MPPKETLPSVTMVGADGYWWLPTWYLSVSCREHW